MRDEASWGFGDFGFRLLGPWGFGGFRWALKTGPLMYPFYTLHRLRAHKSERQNALKQVWDN